MVDEQERFERVATAAMQGMLASGDIDLAQLVGDTEVKANAELAGVFADILIEFTEAIIAKFDAREAKKRPLGKNDYAKCSGRE